MAGFLSEPDNEPATIATVTRGQVKKENGKAESARGGQKTITPTNPSSDQRDPGLTSDPTFREFLSIYKDRTTTSDRPNLEKPEAPLSASESEKLKTALPPAPATGSTSSQNEPHQRNLWVMHTSRSG
jgi:hypothetical protein